MNAVCEPMHDSKMPETRIFLNDLYENDFNSVIKAIPSFYEELKEVVGLDQIQSTFSVSVVPGSFYGKLFESQSMHFIYSSCSLHWLSQVPPLLQGENNEINRGNVALGKTSPPIVHAAYLDQFQKDFTNFLRLRSKEMVSSGCMVLTLLGRSMSDPFAEECHLDFTEVAFALNDLVGEGATERKKLDAFNMPFYAPYIEELAEVIECEGSFDIFQLAECKQHDGRSWAEQECIVMAKVYRAALEPMLTAVFEEELMDHLFDKVGEQLANYKSFDGVFLMVYLSKKN